MLNENFMFYPSTFHGFDFTPYRQGGDKFKFEIKEAGIKDKNDAIAIYLFSFAYSQSIFYLYTNSYFYNGMDDHIKRIIINATKYTFERYLHVIISEFIPWLKDNYDRYDFYQIDFYPIYFQPQYLERVCIKNLFLDEQFPQIASISKLIHTFYQMKMCKNAETSLKEERNYSELYSAMGIDLDSFKDNNGFLKLPDHRKYKDNIPSELSMFELLFTRWQAYCFIEIIYQQFQKSKNCPDMYRDTETFSYFKANGELEDLINFLKDIYENPYQARFLYYMHEVNHAQDPLGNTDSKIKEKERLKISDPYNYKRYINECSEFSYSMLRKEFKQLINRHSKVKTNMFSKLEVPFEEFWESDKNPNKIINFWTKEKNYLYILDLLILEKILSIKLGSRNLDHIFNRITGKVFTRALKDIDARFNYHAIMMLSMKENIDKKLAELKMQKNSPQSHGVTAE
ncbi:hypothetical protein B4919_06325 [Francisella tularensis subsp. novicida]|uniref:hypothetical protein n=1 Tax=Francisella tularensis TaxID=263 RepID=UPI000CE2ADFE|nr:hypothetical protein [Francisella tularensis]AVC44423.1 hypothetical protein B4919_06325 [Francisella tularensis subsp. novicida]